MPAGILSINGYDAYKRWGISMKETGLTALMTPAASKTRVENSYRKLNGRHTLNYLPRREARDLTLEIHMFASSSNEFFSRYQDFCENVLAGGELHIVTSYQPDVCYHCYYVNCAQFGEFNTLYASFSLRLEEPDPTDRTKSGTHFKDPD